MRKMSSATQPEGATPQNPGWESHGRDARGTETPRVYPPAPDPRLVCWASGPDRKYRIARPRHSSKEASMDRFMGYFLPIISMALAVIAIVLNYLGY